MALADVITQLDDLIGTETDQRIWKALELVRSALNTIAETTTTELTSTDNAVARFNGVEGAIQNSGVLVDDSDNVSGIGTLGLSGDQTWTAAAVTPTLTQADETTASTTGDAMGIIAQSCTGATSTGGTAFIQGGTGTTANGGAAIRDSSGNAVVATTGADNTLGFYGATPATKPTVTGSAGANAALISLLSELETLGLITDSSS